MRPADSKLAESARALIISSDGHAMAKIADYRPYLPARFQEEFDAFLEQYGEYISDLGIIDPGYLRSRLDDDVVDDWSRNVVAPGRLDGMSDPSRRQEILDEEGIAAEVLFPDFGTAFELSPGVASALRYSRTPEQADVANRAHNRWLVDFCAVAPHRFFGLAGLSFDDVEAAIEEVRWAKKAGLVGIVLPHFDENVPLYHSRHDPIWNELATLGMIVHSHAAASSTTRHVLGAGPTPHPACARTIRSGEAFFNTRQILPHLIWGGVLERHPSLKVVLTEQGSGWITSALEGMDYSYDGSYLQRGLREFIPLKPSEYFERQVFLGSSIFSREEIELRHQIGLNKMMLGMDYPHHEGTWGAGPGTSSYLQATLGVAGVPIGEAEILLSRTAIEVYGFDAAALASVAGRIGPKMTDILTPPIEDKYPRGDVKKPIGVGFQ
jgi:predicted TIM-barrel fold metal-dependent hydrolase